MANAAYIVAAQRSIVAPRGGVFKTTELHDIAAPVLSACLKSADVQPDQIDEVILSNALYGGGNPARMAALAAGLSLDVAGLSIDRQCAGGIDAVLLATDMIKSGRCDMVLAGGAESASRAPMRLRTDPLGGQSKAYTRPPFAPLPFADPDMAEAAAMLAENQGITQDAQIDWTINSHNKATAAADRLRSEIVSLGNPPTDIDSYARPLTAPICKRSPVLAGSIVNATTAVNADAAAFVFVVSERALASVKTDFALRISGGLTLGAQTDMPGLAPVAAIKTALSQANMSTDMFDVTEIMEAYAAQAIACVKGAGLDAETCNKGGGALARGHPIGASGAVLAVRLYHELKRGGELGLAAIAAAGGLGSALILARD